MSSKSGMAYTLAAVAGAMSSFELGASMLASSRRKCSFVLLNTLSIPSTFTEYMDNQMVKRSDEPLWINDFAVEFPDAEYFCKDTGVRWILPLFIYALCVGVLYQRYRGNRAQDAIIAFYLFIGALIGAIAGLNIKDIATGLLPASAWLALVSMPLHIEENWKEKRGTLRFE